MNSAMKIYERRKYFKGYKFTILIEKYVIFT